jgi:hypothetical protein
MPDVILGAVKPVVGRVFRAACGSAVVLDELEEDSAREIERLAAVRGQPGSPTRPCDDERVTLALSPALRLAMYCLPAPKDSFLPRNSVVSGPIWTIDSVVKRHGPCESIELSVVFTRHRPLLSKTNGDMTPLRF